MHSHRRGRAALAILAGLVATTTAVAVPAVEPAVAAAPSGLPAAYRSDFDVATIRSNGNPDNRYDIVIEGDGYAQDDIADYYAPIASRLADCFFTPGQFDREPYLRYAKFFNVHRIDAISHDSGNDQFGADRDSVRSDDSYPDRTVIAEQSAERAGISIDARLANAPRGIGYAVGPWAETLDSCEHALHESGHSFYGLGDEYNVQHPTASCVEPPDPNLTIESDPAKVKWRAWLGFQRASENQGPIGIYSPIDGCLKRPIGGRTLTRMWAEGGFTAVDREVVLRAIYGAVRPIDAATPTTSTIADPALWIRVVDPDVIKVKWTVYDSADVAVASAFGARLDTAALGLLAGSYRVEGVAYDEAVEHAFSDRSPQSIDGVVTTAPHPLDLVRDPALLAAMQQKLTWAVSLTGTGTSQAVAASLESKTVTVDRSSSTGSTAAWLPNRGTGVTYNSSLPAAFGIDPTGRISVVDASQLSALPLGTSTATVWSTDPVSGISLAQPIVLIIADHRLNVVRDEFDDGVPGTDRNGGRGFRTSVSSTSNAVVESGGALRLQSGSRAVTKVRSNETIDMRTGSGVRATWSVAALTLGSNGTAAFGLFDNFSGGYSADIFTEYFARGLEIVVEPTMTSVFAKGEPTKPAIKIAKLVMPAPTGAFTVALSVAVSAQTITYVATVAGRVVGKGRVFAGLLRPITGSDDGWWGRKTQAVAMRAENSAFVTIDRVETVPLRTPSVLKPLQSHPIGAQREQVGGTYRFDLSRFVDDVHTRGVTFAVAGLPPGLTATADGLVTGVPTTAGSWSVSAVATAADGQRATLSYALQTDPAGPTNVTPAPSPTVRYRFDGDAFESGGAIGGDSWARSAYPIGVPTYVPGLNGSALVSSPTSGTVLRTHVGLDTGDASTYAVWIKPEAKQSSTPSVILHRDFHLNAFDISMQPTTGSDAEVRVAMSYGGGPDAPVFPMPVATASGVAANLVDGGWHHVASVFDRKTLTLYVDGVLIASVPAVGSAATMGRDSGDVQLGVPGVATFRGAIDDLQIWTSSLSAAQVRSLVPEGQPMPSLG